MIYKTRLMLLGMKSEVDKTGPMTQEEIKKLKVGDKILISTFHYRSGKLKYITRIIRNIREHIDYPSLLVVEVKCFGWANFVLRDHEIHELVTN